MIISHLQRAFRMLVLVPKWRREASTRVKGHVNYESIIGGYLLPRTPPNPQFHFLPHFLCLALPCLHLTSPALPSLIGVL